MFSESNNHFRDLLLLIAGCLGAFWFFYSYKSLEPLASVSDNVQKNEVLSKMDAIVRSWQIYPSDTKQNVKMSSYRGLIDSLNRKLGKVGFSKEVQKPENKEFPLFYWDIRTFLKEDFYNNSGEALSKIKMSPQGEIITYSMSNAAIKKASPYNKNVIKASLGLNYGYTEENKVIEDSLLNELLNFQVRTQGENDLNNFQNIQRFAQKLGAPEKLENEDIFNREMIWSGATSYLNESYWKRYNFNRDSLEYKESDNIRFVRLYLSSKDSVFGFLPTIQLDLLPAGGIKAISAQIKNVDIPSNPYSELIRLITLFSFLCFGIWLISVFYLRIKAKAIDTQPAFVVSVLAGFMLSFSQILRLANNLEFSFESLKSIDITQELFVIGLMGAVSSVIFFVLTSVSDSVTRQHWPEKLKAWDLARRGFFKNKPVGRSAIYALCIAGIMVGLWTLIVQVLPTTYLTANIDFKSSSYLFPSVAVMLINLLTSILLVISSFMVLGNQSFSLTKRIWPIPIISGFIFAVILEPFLSVDINPFEISIVINFLVGVGFGLFYIRFGFLTLVLSVFVFLGFFATKNGWIIQNSPDANTFYMFVGILCSMVGIGFLFIQKGSEKKDLPDYMPSYLEDQAKEQRMNQELEIAQSVQKAFLPSRVEHLVGIDIAGVCEPAQETGGDYYDMISLGKSRMAIAIGDVSGKGIQAAFYMTFVKGVLHSLSALILSPLELLNQLNRLFKENATRGTFVSMIYGILEADKRTFTFARAGHNPMLVVRANGDSEWLQPKGIGIGVANSMLFLKGTEEDELKLKEGDVAILYTDGITEMLNISNQFYGEDRLEKIVKGVRKGASSKILDIIISDVTEFKGVAKQHDDMTLVVIKADASVNK